MTFFKTIEIFLFIIEVIFSNQATKKTKR